MNDSDETKMRMVKALAHSFKHMGEKIFWEIDGCEENQCSYQGRTQLIHETERFVERLKRTKWFWEW